jgi:SAM-dependent methyltransferase
MSEERRAASVPDSAEPGALPDLASSPPPAIEIGASEPIDGGSAPLRRRPRTLRIPDDDVSRPHDGADAPQDGERRASDRPASNRLPPNRPPAVDLAPLEPVFVALVPMRIITINPPPASEVEVVSAEISDDASTPRAEALRVPEDGWSQPLLPEETAAPERDSAEDTLESIYDADPSSPRVRAVAPATSIRVPGIEGDGEDVRFEEDVPTPALPRVEMAVDTQGGERRSDPGEAPEIAPEDLVDVEAAPRAVSPPAPPPPAKKAPAPPRPPLVIVPPHVGNLAPQSGEGIGSRRKGRLWWEDFFNDDYLRTTEKITDEQIGREVDFIEESLSIERGGAVLDLACGTGRHAVELGARGYEVVGFDLSLAMLARAGDDAQERAVKLNIVQGDMRDMTFEEQFDGVFCWNTSFGYFEEEKNAQVIDRVHRALKAGGLFLLDVINRDFLIRQSPSLAWFEGDGCVCMDEMIVDFITSRMRIKRTMMLDDGRSREVEYSLRTYSLHELGKILHDHGFKVCEVSGRPATPGVFFGNESPRTIILAEKR